jgi:hypothetical protein
MVVPEVIAQHRSPRRSPLAASGYALIKSSLFRKTSSNTVNSVEAEKGESCTKSSAQTARKNRNRNLNWTLLNETRSANSQLERRPGDSSCTEFTSPLGDED